MLDIESCYALLSSALGDDFAATGSDHLEYKWHLRDWDVISVYSYWFQLREITARDHIKETPQIGKLSSFLASSRKNHTHVTAAIDGERCPPEGIDAHIGNAFLIGIDSINAMDSSIQ